MVVYHDNHIRVFVKDAGFQNIQILNEKIYLNENHFQDNQINKNKSIIIKAVTK
jgi:hypothetical protein